MAERFKAPVLKTGEGASSPWVRIPPHPPFDFDFIDKFGILVDFPTNYPPFERRIVANDGEGVLAVTAGAVAIPVAIRQAADARLR